MSAASVRLVPAAACGRPTHRVYQVQEVGHRAPGLQRRAGEGPQVSSLPYHTIYTIPYHTIPPGPWSAKVEQVRVLRSVTYWQVVAISI